MEHLKIDDDICYLHIEFVAKKKMKNLPANPFFPVTGVFGDACLRDVDDFGETGKVGEVNVGCPEVTVSLEGWKEVDGMEVISSMVESSKVDGKEMILSVVDSEIVDCVDELVDA